MAQESTERLLSSIRFGLPFSSGRLFLLSLVPINKKENETSTTLRPSYRWPYIAGAMLLFWLMLMVMWTFWSVRGMHEQDETYEGIDVRKNPTKKTD